MRDTEHLRPPNNDLWHCLPDGDNDLLSDGCIRIGTLNDLTAEWTGGVFDSKGRHVYVSVKHNISGRGLILDITGLALDRVATGREGCTAVGQRDGLTLRSPSVNTDVRRVRILDVVGSRLMHSTVSACSRTRPTARC
jgi:hypothetical protein